MRDMAHVVTLESVIPMKNKDKIVSAVFSETAYEAIIPKEGANPGRFYCFIEADSILPEDEPQWEFLRKRCYKENLHGFLIKPMKMGEKEDGSPVRSWGLAIPVDELPITEGEKRRCKPGTDLTDALRIKKYEPVEDASPTKKNGGKFPPFIKFCFKVPFLKWIGNLYKKAHTNKGIDFPEKLISKSDETTIQNAKSFIYKFAQNPVVVSHKMEGQSCVSSDTIVDTENGQKTIKELVDSNYSGKVWSMNEHTGEKELKDVEKCHCLENDEKVQWFELETEDGRTLKITGNDMVYLPELKCYRRVDTLVGNEKLLIND